MKRIYIKEPVCIGCHLCEVYCQVEHSQTKDLIKTFKREFPQPLPRVSIEERKPVAFSVRCQHCDEPPCVYACLSGALQREVGSGVVTVDEEYWLLDLHTGLPLWCYQAGYRPGKDCQM